MSSGFLTGLVIGIVLSLLISAVAIFWAARSFKKKFNTWKDETLRKEVVKALQIQRPVVKGKISEQVFPLLSDKVGNLSDLRFVGDPIDYVYFDGLSEAREGNGDSIRIKFMEIKTGDAKINRAEGLVKDAVNYKKVDWEEIRL